MGLCETSHRMLGRFGDCCGKCWVAVVVVGRLTEGVVGDGFVWAARLRRGLVVVWEARERCGMLGRMLRCCGAFLDRQSSLWFARQMRKVVESVAAHCWVPLHQVLALAKPTDGRRSGSEWSEEARRSRK